MSKKAEAMGPTKWSKLRDGISVAAGVATAAGMLIAAWGLIEAHRATIEANRAWIGPVGMSLNGPLEERRPISFMLRLVNYGREPAVGITWKWHQRLVQYIVAEGPETTYFGRNDTCSGLEPDANEGITVYPGDSPQHWVGADFGEVPGNDTIRQLVLAHKRSLVIEGCVAYLTQGEKHTSAFRFFLRDDPRVSSWTQGPPGEPGYPSWRFNITFDGNQAN